MNHTIFKGLVISGLVVSLRLVFLCETVPPQEHPNFNRLPELVFFFGPAEVKGRFISRRL